MSAEHCRVARDYAPRNLPKRNGGKSAARKPSGKPRGASPGLPGWVWMVVGLSFGLVVAALVYVGRPAKPMDMSPTSQARAAKNAPKTVEIPPKEPSRFAFYEMLPSYEMVVSDEELNAPPPKPKAAVAAASSDAARPTPIAAQPSPAAKPATPSAIVPTSPVPVRASAGGERYLIQVAAYRARADAEQQRAALALVGLAARVEQVTIDNTQTWFRVRLGPYSDVTATQAAQRSLQAQGMKGVVMKVKG